MTESIFKDRQMTGSQVQQLEGLLVDTGVMFSNHKDIYKKGVEKRQRKLFVRFSSRQIFVKDQPGQIFLICSASIIYFVDEYFTIFFIYPVNNSYTVCTHPIIAFPFSIELFNF
jgi:hypothetical protein